MVGKQHKTKNPISFSMHLAFPPLSSLKFRSSPITGKILTNVTHVFFMRTSLAKYSLTAPMAFQNEQRSYTGVTYTVCNVDVIRNAAASPVNDPGARNNVAAPLQGDVSRFL